MRSRRRLYALALAGVAAPACTGPAPLDQPPELDAPAATSPAALALPERTAAAQADLDRRVAARKRLAASGRHLFARAARAGDAASSTGPEMIASLDIPPAFNPTLLALTSPDPDAAVVRTNLGLIRPRKGPSFLLLSTGRSGNDSVYAEPGTDFGAPGTDGDVATLRFRVTVPPGVNRLSFDYTFLSAESPDFIGTDYNDTFTVRVTDALGANRTIATASVNSSTFHLASDTTVGRDNPFHLYTDSPFGVNNEFNLAGFMEVDAGTTDIQHVSVPVASGNVVLEFDIRDLGDGILDSAVIIDSVAFSAVDVADPHGGLIDEFGQVVRAPDARLASGGTPARAVAADGVTQVLLRSKVDGPGKATFSIASGSAADGSLSANAETLAWSQAVTVDATPVNGQWYAFALYRSPPDFNRGGDEAAKTRDVALAVAYAPAPGGGGAFNQPLSVGVVRPPVVVVPDVWSSCQAWDEHGSIKDPRPEASPALGVAHPFTVSCATYPTSKGFLRAENRKAVATAINEALEKLRGVGVAATRADVIGHGMGGLLARRYVDEFSFVRFDNFNAGAINRLITMDTPNLGSRMADEIVRFRDFTKARDAQSDPPTKDWDNLKDTLGELGVFIDDEGDDGDVAIDEMTTCDPAVTPSCKSIIDQIGAAAGPPRSTFYHALFGTGGRSLPRPAARSLLPYNAKTLYDTMEALHPKTYPDAIPQAQKQKLIFGPQSLVFCQAADQHDLFATESEQKGGLEAPFATGLPVAAASLRSGHFLIHNNKAHTEKLVELLNAPVNGGPFAPSMPPPKTVPKVNNCPLAFSPPAPEDAAARALAAGGIAFASPAPGTAVSPGDNVSVVVNVSGEAQPQSVLIVGAGNSVLLEQAPFEAEFVIPAEAIGALNLRAVAFYGEGGLAFAPPVTLSVNVAATLASIEVLDGDVVLPRPGSTRQLSVIGNFSDGVRRDITKAALGTQYVSSSVTPVATVSPDGLITAVAPGTATIAMRNGGVVTSITAKIGEPACGDEVLDPGEECDDGNTASNDGCSSTCVIDNYPPDCSGAGASPALILASSTPNFWPIEIEGVSDPDGDPVTVTATQVRQDEPVSDLWCPGGTCADAKLAPLAVRAERDTWAEEDPQPDGRVYHITFHAIDARGAACMGVVTVCVQREYDVMSCGDGGPLYDSLTPTP